MKTKNVSGRPIVESVSITLSGIPWSLLKDLDEIATAENRSRSRQTRLLLEEIVATKKTRLIGFRQIHPDGASGSGRRGESVVGCRRNERK